LRGLTLTTVERRKWKLVSLGQLEVERVVRRALPSTSDGGDRTEHIGLVVNLDRQLCCGVQQSFDLGRVQLALPLRDYCGVGYFAWPDAWSQRTEAVQRFLRRIRLFRLVGLTK